MRKINIDDLALFDGMGVELCNFGGLVVLEVSGEKITTGFSFGNGVKKVYTTPIKFDNEGSAYFTRYGVNYFLSDIMRV